MATTTPTKMQRFVDFMAANPSPIDCIVDEYYDLPCINYDGIKHHNPCWGDWVPLIGLLKQDKEHINFPWWHIHVDTRFLVLPFQDVHDWLRIKALLTPVCLSGPDPKHQSTYENIINNAVLQVRPLQCKRAEPAQFPGNATWRKALQQAYADSRVVNGICPHRGYPIACGRKLAPGIRQCPGHGLVWSDDGYQVC